MRDGDLYVPPLGAIRPLRKDVLITVNDRLPTDGA
jgi:hypothetical protein